MLSGLFCKGVLISMLRAARLRSPKRTTARSDLAKKQIATENKENELTAEIAKLKKENEQATDKIAYLD